MSLQALWLRSIRTGVVFGQDRERAVFRSVQQLGAEPQRLIRRMADAEHPLVAAHRSHAAPNLVGQRLKSQVVIGRRQRAGDRIAWAVPASGRRGRRRSLPRTAGSEASDIHRTAHGPWPDSSGWRGCESDGSRRGKTVRGPARKGFRSCGETDRALRTRPATAPRLAFAAKLPPAAGREAPRLLGGDNSNRVRKASLCLSGNSRPLQPTRPALPAVRPSGRGFRRDRCRPGRWRAARRSRPYRTPML